MKIKKINYLKIKRIFLGLLLVVSFGFNKISTVHAQDIDFSWLSIANVASGGSSISQVEDLLGPAVNIFLGFAISMAMLAIIRAGIKYVMAKGDAKATNEAKQALTYSIFAFILAVSAFTVMKLVLVISGAGTGGGQIYLQNRL